MGGYLGTPQRTLTRRVENVELTIHRVADILNENDPDVSFAYTFCGSSEMSIDGKSNPAKEAAERGRQKAQIEYHDPEWRGFYDQWVESLKGLGKHEVDVWDYGDRVADVCVNGVANGMAYSINLSAVEIDVLLKGALIGAQATLKLGESCLGWIKEQTKEIKVAQRVVNRVMKKSSLFLIDSSDDD